MGVIFSSTAIAEGKYPKQGAHEEAGREILQKLFLDKDEFSDDPRQRLLFYINSGMIYGSTVLDRATRRSDLDVLVVFHDNGREKAIQVAREIFAEVEEKYHVPVESNILSIESLFDGAHAIDDLFAQHLIRIQGQIDPQWSYNWPVDALAMRTEPLSYAHVRNIALRYAHGKARQQIRALIEYRGDADLQVMRRALELPTAIGRKVSAVINGPTMYWQKRHEDKVAPLQVAERLGLYRASDRLSDFDGVYDGYESSIELIKIDEEYNQLLEATINGQISIEDYEQWIQARYEEVCKKALAVALAWHNVVKRILDDPNINKGPGEQLQLVSTEEFQRRKIEEYSDSDESMY